GVAAIVALEILFLRFGPSLYISAYTIVLVFLGLLVLAVFAGEVLSWVLFAQSLTRRFRRDGHQETGPREDIQAVRRWSPHNFAVHSRPGLAVLTPAADRGR